MSIQDSEKVNQEGHRPDGTVSGCQKTAQNCGSRSSQTQDSADSTWIKTVALIGAGAIGCYFIWGMADVLGDRFCVVAEGDRAERLRRNGVVINGSRFDLNVKSPDEARGADLLLIATKYDGLENAIPAVRTITEGADTIVLSLLNGIDSEEILAEAIGEEKILNSYMVIASHRKGNSVNFDPEVTKGMVFGEKNTPEKTSRCAAVEQLFAQCRSRAAWVPNIVQMQWAKYARNISYNIPQAILSVGIGAFRDSEHVWFIARQLEKEVDAVGKAYGVDVPSIDRHFNDRYDPRSRYSTLQDLDAGRHTEIEMFCGVLMKKAAAKNIPVPTAELCYHLVRALEEKNDGLFDYQ